MPGFLCRSPLPYCAAHAHNAVPPLVPTRLPPPFACGSFAVLYRRLGPAPAPPYFVPARIPALSRAPAATAALPLRLWHRSPPPRCLRTCALSARGQWVLLRAPFATARAPFLPLLRLPPLPTYRWSRTTAAMPLLRTPFLRAFCARHCTAGFFTPACCCLPHLQFYLPAPFLRFHWFLCLPAIAHHCTTTMPTTTAVCPGPSTHATAFLPLHTTPPATTTAFCLSRLYHRPVLPLLPPHCST